jgi:glycosyltransferase involved in cell wall biosynthesis
MKALCLVMVVNNQAAPIRRCLESVRPFIGHWIVCDTGSTDGTQALVNEVLQGIPGSLHEIPNADSGANRTQAIRLARGKAEYHLLIDADMTLKVTSEFRDGLEADCYLARTEDPLECWVERLLSDRHEWRFTGAAHDFPFAQTSRTREKLAAFTVARQGDGVPDPAALKRDVERLKEALERGANVPRCAFYLAQSYRDLGNLPLAVEYYEQRATMGGWAEEVWYSVYQIARLQQRLGIAWMIVLSRYLEAYQLRPSRIEALYHVARFCRERQQYQLGYLFAHPAIGVPYPEDLLFVERSIYEHELPLEYALCCHHLGMKAEAVRVAQSLLANPAPPEAARQLATLCAG